MPLEMTGMSGAMNHPESGNSKTGQATMARTCITVVDGAHARFFTLEIPEDPIIDGGARLIEHQDLVNPEADIPEHQLFSDRRGRAHASPAGAAHALDDGRERHLEELERRYVRRLVDETERFVQRERATRLLLVAEPRLLGVLREQLRYDRLRGVEVVELGENLSQRPVAQIQSILALRGVVPAAASPDVGVFRPRGQAPVAR
jgi:protein required for attachment to host cells